MKRFKRLMLLLSTACLCVLPALTASAAGGGGAAPIVIVADTRKLTGVMHWWASQYNDSHAMFTVMTIILIPLVGCIFGLLADVVMNWIGIDLKKRSISEH